MRERSRARERERARERVQCVPPSLNLSLLPLSLSRALSLSQAAEEARDNTRLILALMRQQYNGVAGSGLQDVMASDSSVLYVGMSLSSLSLFPIAPSLPLFLLALSLSLSLSLSHTHTLFYTRSALRCLPRYPCVKMCVCGGGGSVSVSLSVSVSVCVCVCVCPGDVPSPDVQTPDTHPTSFSARPLTNGSGEGRCEVETRDTDKGPPRHRVVAVFGHQDSSVLARGLQPSPHASSSEPHLSHETAGTPGSIGMRGGGERRVSPMTRSFDSPRGYVCVCVSMTWDVTVSVCVGGCLCVYASGRMCVCAVWHATQQHIQVQESRWRKTGGGGGVD